MPETILLPKFRAYKNGEEFYLSAGLAEEGGKPKVYVSRWDADSILRQSEQTQSSQTNIQLPTLYHTFKAAKQDKAMHNSVFSFPAEWQSTLILNPNAEPETAECILMDYQERVLRKSNYPRSLIPIETHEDNGRKIVITNVFNIPFKLENSRYNPEDLDPETGFLKKLDPEGQYCIWFGTNEKLYAVSLYWVGDARCSWGPSVSLDRVGFRGFSTGNIPQELLDLDTEIQIETEPIETDYRQPERTEPKKPEISVEPEKPKIPKDVIDNGTEDTWKRGIGIELD